MRLVVLLLAMVLVAAGCGPGDGRPEPPKYQPPVTNRAAWSSVRGLALGIASWSDSRVRLG